MFNTQTIQLNNKYDSLFVSVLKLKGIKLSNQYDSIIVSNKCGLGIILTAKENIKNFSQEQQDVLLKILQRQPRQTSVLTPSKKFRVHYDTTGSNSVKYSLEEFLLAIDSSYNYEVNYLGFLPPPEDFGAGGDKLFDIYIQDIEPIYGYTEPESELTGNRYTSFIVIDNDFENQSYYTKGIDAARVTIAHELHHAIQIGNYINKYSQESYFYEMTSTAMEEFVFDSVNDYYAYLPVFFRTTSKIFTGHGGYDLALWNVFLYSKFEKNIFTRQWELLILNPALLSIKRSIEEQGADFKETFAKFFYDIYFTDYRADSTKYFKEGSNYPLVKFEMTSLFRPPIKTFSGFSQPVAAQYFLLVDSLLTYVGKPDSIAIIIVNVNVDSALVWDINPKYSYYNYMVTNNSEPNYVEISTNLKGKFEAIDLHNWRYTTILNNLGPITPKPVFEPDESPFPQPFRYSSNNSIIFFTPVKDASEVELNVYSVDMNLVYSSMKKVELFENKMVITWDGLSNDRRKLNSGVYFYTAVSGDTVKKGKLIIFND